MGKDQKNAFDVVIVGGGQVGMLTALCLARFFPQLSLCLLEANQFGLFKDPRSTALAPGATNMLDQLGCWAELEKDASAISAMKITDSALNDHVRPIFLALEENVADGPMGHIVDNQKLNAALAQKVKQTNIEIIESTKVSQISATDGRLTVSDSKGDTYNIYAKMIGAADGANSRLREWAGIKTMRHDYDQRGLVATISHARDNKGVAFQHFLEEGPFASLPLGPTRSSIVWSVSKKRAEHLLNSDEETQNNALNQTMGTYLGAAKLETKLMGFPLNLVLAKKVYTGKLALFGDAAHKIHPLAGQGLNMGFADVAAFADALAEALKLGMGLDTSFVFEHYASARRFDIMRKAATTDVLNRLFSNGIEPIKIIRDTGIGILNHLEGVKNNVIKQASGTGPNEPSLMRGFAPGRAP